MGPLGSGGAAMPGGSGVSVPAQSCLGLLFMLAVAVAVPPVTWTRRGTKLLRCPLARRCLVRPRLACSGSSGPRC